MKILIASDSYKGSLSSEEVNNTIARAVKDALAGDVTCRCLQMADGGEGTVEALLHNLPTAMVIRKKVSDPIGDPVDTEYILDGEVAFIEMAGASGLTLVPDCDRNPLETTTFGTGELIADALTKGARDIYVAIGGSATNDGGMGVMTALGYDFLDENGVSLLGVGANLRYVRAISEESVMPELRDARIHVMCDVDNPLTGNQGATYTYGRQKCPSHWSDEKVQDVLAALEQGMQNYKYVLETHRGISMDKIPGLGAAGGLGAALYALARGEMKKGIEVVLDISRFRELAAEADIVISGEGCTDEQTLHGKVICGIGRICRELGKPLYVISGRIETTMEKLQEIGVTRAYAVTDESVPIEEAMENAKSYLYRRVVNLFSELV